MPPSSMRDRVQGMFLGIAIGDALGVPVETYDAARIKREFDRVLTYRTNPGHKWAKNKCAGQWSDDTQLTLAIAESLIACGRVDINDMARRQLAIIDELGDIEFGGSTRDAFARLRNGISPLESGKTVKPNRGKGNALPMKIAPVGAYLASLVINKRSDASMAKDVSGMTAMTHHTEVALQSAFAQVTATAYCFLEDLVVTEFWEALLLTIDHARTLGFPGDSEELGLPFRMLAAQDLTALSFDEVAALQGTGKDRFKVYRSLPLAYTCFLRNPHSMESMYEAVAVGGDTDTNASIVGGLLGALNGANIFPPDLVKGLWLKDRIISTTDRFCNRFDLR